LVTEKGGDLRYTKVRESKGGFVMKQKIKWIALAALLVSIVVAAPILYKVFIPSGGGVGAISTGEETRAETGQRLLAPDFTVLDE
jgi:hypothetical protein